MTLGVVLSGGGARGAYEAGVLQYVFSDLPGITGRIPATELVCGTSVGAINGAYLAGVLDEPREGVQKLVKLWSEIALGDVMGFGLMQASRLYRVLLGGGRGAGLLDVKPLTDLIAREMPWKRLIRNLRQGTLRALVISTTHVPTGKTVVHVDGAPGVQLPHTLPKNITVRGERIRPEHVLASAAIPLLFPPVPIAGDLYCDGGLRLNTPMSPAIAMGATRLLVVGMAKGDPEKPDLPQLPTGRAPGATFLLGKVLNAFLLDHVIHDLHELHKVNAILDAGAAVYGPGFVDRINDELIRRGETPRRPVRSFTIRPSEDIGRMAGQHLRRNEPRMGKLLGRSLLRLLDIGEGAEADLASYLLFDGEFAQRLVALGRADAARRHAELADFALGG